MRFSTRSTNPTGLPVSETLGRSTALDPVLGGPAGAVVEEEEEFTRPDQAQVFPRHLLDCAGVLAKPTGLASKVLVLVVKPVDLTGQPLVLATRLD